MPDQSINSLFGMLATKKLPASGILKTTSNTKQGNHENNNFLSKLEDSMKNARMSDEQATTSVPSESNNITDTDDINHIIKLLSMGLQTNPTANTDDNQSQLNQEVNQNIIGKEITNIIINNSANGNTSTSRIETNTLLENALLNNQELNPLDGPNTNALINAQERATYFSDKLNTTQGTTNIAQEITGEINQEQLQTSFSDKSSTTQNNTKMNEQRILDIINIPGLAEAATESTGNESVLQSSKLPGQQALESQKESGANPLNISSGINKDIVQGQTTAPLENNLNNSQNKTNITDNQNPVPTIEKADLNPIPEAYKISNNKIINPNISSPTEESAQDKIDEILKGQHQDKTLFANAGKNPQTQQGLTQAHSHTENNESPKIFDVSTNTTEAKAAKLFDNTTLTNNNGVNADEAAIPVNTSSDSSFFNNQATDTPDEFQVTAANIKQNSGPEKNFNNTLSQISNSNKPLGPLGNDVADNIIQNAKLYTQGGKSEVKILLNPPELGTLKLEFAFDDDILETKITVERSSVKDVIEKDIPRLRELISNADIDVGKLDVSLQDKENGRMDFMNKDFNSDSKSKSAQDFLNQENEYYEENADNDNEETMVNNTESTQINYLI
jgi:flagellar hook-length control protein FliK